MQMLGTVQTLGTLAEGRDNNFNLIRAIAATAVLVSHAYPIALGPGTPEPLKALTGHALGSIAVYVFFVISGFLITASYLRSSGPVSFLVARGLRLFPGLLVSLALVAFVMGPLVTSLPLGAYLGHAEVYTFMARNLTLVEPQYILPGVFEDNPMRAVEGSIWTLVFEVACYMGVFVLGLLGWLKRPALVAVALAIFFAAWLAREITGAELIYHIRQILTLGLPFALGTAAWIWRDRIALHWAGVLATAALAWALSGTALSFAAFALALGYGTFWLAYIPGGWLRAYNRLGDYSYGIYIYAFPAQGLAVWLAGPMTPLANMALGLALTLPPSIASWHLIESPALSLRRRLTGWLTRRPVPAR